MENLQDLEYAKYHDDNLKTTNRSTTVLGLVYLTNTVCQCPAHHDRRRRGRTLQMQR